MRRPEPITPIVNSTPISISLESTEALLRQNKVAVVQYTEALIAEMNDPVNKRPFSPTERLTGGPWFLFTHQSPWVDRNQIYNPKTGAWEIRQTATIRGAAKSTLFTKKKNLHLVRNKQFYENPYYEDDRWAPRTYLMVELDACHLKNEKYVFDTRLDVENKWWLKPTPSY